jgi:hypothetical protein
VRPVGRFGLHNGASHTVGATGTLRASAGGSATRKQSQSKLVHREHFALTRERSFDVLAHRRERLRSKPPSSGHKEQGAKNTAKDAP